MRVRRYTYYYWNLAQQAQWAKARPNERFFTINRAFTPGMQRFPATTWTGDRQDCSHEVMLRFSMYGQPYHECASPLPPRSARAPEQTSMLGEVASSAADLPQRPCMSQHSPS